MPNVCARTGFSQPPRKKLVLFHGQEDVGVQYIRVFLLPYCKVVKKLHYIAWASWSLHTLSAVLIAEAKLLINEEEVYRVLALVGVLPAWLEKRGGLVVVCTVTPVVVGSLVSVLETVNFYS